jgi:hypothetical protein
MRFFPKKRKVFFVRNTFQNKGECFVNFYYFHETSTLICIPPNLLSYLLHYLLSLSLKKKKTNMAELSSSSSSSAANQFARSLVPFSFSPAVQESAEQYIEFAETGTFPISQQEILDSLQDIEYQEIASVNNLNQDYIKWLSKELELSKDRVAELEGDLDQAQEEAATSQLKVVSVGRSLDVYTGLFVENRVNVERLERKIERRDKTISVLKARVGRRDDTISAIKGDNTHLKCVLNLIKDTLVEEEEEEEEEDIIILNVAAPQQTKKRKRLSQSEREDEHESNFTFPSRNKRATIIGQETEKAFVSHLYETSKNL